MLVLERADCAYGYRRNRPATNTGMEKNARIKTGTRSKTGSARTSTGILLIRVLTFASFGLKYQCLLLINIAVLIQLWQS